MTPRRKLLISLAFTGLLFGTCAVTGTSLLPTTLAIGPCLRDWTSPSSYRPRSSPLATVRVPVGAGTVQLCYGRPSARGRQVFGGLVPYGELWRSGANEPTRIYTDTPITIAGLRLEPGRYSLYSRPDSVAWEITLSRSTLHWGNDLSPSVRAQDIGTVLVPVQHLPAPVETLTIRSEPHGTGGQDLLLEWEQTGIRLEVRSAAAAAAP
jgi:hypothetical protein